VVLAVCVGERQKGGPAQALRVEASFCLAFFVSFCGNDKKKRNAIKAE
jgi:hypothetical protein